MREHGGSSGLPWRGPNPLRWTLALALALALAALADAFPSGFVTVSGRPTEWWNAPAPPLATWAALSALGAALLAIPTGRPTGWPWSGPGTPRDKVANARRRRGSKAKRKRTPLARGPLSSTDGDDRR